MKIPVHSGNTSLAYVTDEERKLLRRRDAVKGSPNKKMSHGLPKLDGGDYLADVERQKALRAKEDALRAAGFKEAYAGGKGDYVWAHAGKGLLAGIPGAPKTPVKASSRPIGIPSSKWLTSSVTVAPTPKPAPKPEPKPTSTSSTTSSSTPTGPGHSWIDDPVMPTTPTTSTPPVSDYTADVKSSSIDPTQLQKPMLDEIVADGVNSELLETRLANLINKNNPLFKAATTKAMQSMAARGLVNSSIAEEAVMNAILSVAMPIAERDATAYMNQRMQNQAYSNEFRAAQNQAYYAEFLQKLQNSMDMAMRQLVERSANWRAVLAQRGAIATTPKMSTSATEAALATVTPDWWA